MGLELLVKEGSGMIPSCIANIRATISVRFVGFISFIILLSARGALAVFLFFSPNYSAKARITTITHIASLYQYYLY